MEAPPEASALEHGLAAFARCAWGEAYEQLSAADQHAALRTDDLVRLGKAAYLRGKDEESASVLTRLHHDCLEHAQIEGAVRAAFLARFGSDREG